jgi:hypothetical protein
MHLAESMGSTAKSFALPNAQSGIGPNPSPMPGSEATFAVAAPTTQALQLSLDSAAHVIPIIRHS